MGDAYCKFLKERVYYLDRKGLIIHNDFKCLEKKVDSDAGVFCKKQNLKECPVYLALLNQE